MTVADDLLDGMRARGLALALVFAAGLVGAAGVALAAIAAHKVESPALATAAIMLMVHAAAGLGIAALSTTLATSRGFVLIGAAMLAAASLFSGDVTLHALTGQHCFPYAAPIGGSTTILSWLALALVAILERRHKPQTKPVE